MVQLAEEVGWSGITKGGGEKSIVMRRKPKSIEEETENYMENVELKRQHL